MVDIRNYMGSDRRMRRTRKQLALIEIRQTVISPVLRFKIGQNLADFRTNIPEP